MRELVGIHVSAAHSVFRLGTVRLSFDACVFVFSFWAQLRLYVLNVYPPFWGWEYVFTHTRRLVLVCGT